VSKKPAFDYDGSLTYTIHAENKDQKRGEQLRASPAEAGHYVYRSG
jgi:hypothetical protein